MSDDETGTYVIAWKKDDPKMEADAAALWEELQILPAMTPSENRVKQLAMLAYDGDRLVGISTLNIRHFEQVRQTIAFFREVVHPDYRRKQVGRFLGRKTYKLIEEYALAHPEEKIGGMGAIYQAPGIGQRAVTREARLALIGYTKRNEQVRIAWFPHFMVPPNAPSA